MSAQLSTRECCESAMQDLDEAVATYGIDSTEANDAAYTWHMWCQELLNEDPDEYNDYMQD